MGDLSGMEALFEGLKVLSKYHKGYQEIASEHDILYLCDHDGEYSDDDLKRLSECGIWKNEEFECWAMWT